MQIDLRALAYLAVIALCIVVILAVVGAIG